jgi:hypothetical protein
VGGCGQSSEPGSATPPAVSAAAAACGQAIKQADQGHTHIATLEHDYPSHPATSGPHHPVPLPGDVKVYTAPVPETRAVHNLEHGYVLVYYRATGAGALAPQVVSALGQRVTAAQRVIMAPYPNLDPESALAFAAWDELQQCGPAVSPPEAVARLAEFATAYRDGPLAPERGLP